MIYGSIKKKLAGTKYKNDRKKDKLKPKEKPKSD
jgi:hypothetical protein